MNRMHILVWQRLLVLFQRWNRVLRLLVLGSLIASCRAASPAGQNVTPSSQTTPQAALVYPNPTLAASMPPTIVPWPTIVPSPTFPPDASLPTTLLLVRMSGIPESRIDWERVYTDTAKVQTLYKVIYGLPRVDNTQRTGCIFDEGRKYRFTFIANEQPLAQMLAYADGCFLLYMGPQRTRGMDRRRTRWPDDNLFWPSLSDLTGIPIKNKKGEKLYFWPLPPTPTPTP